MIGRPTVAAENRPVTRSPAPAGYAAPVYLSPGAQRVELRIAGAPEYTLVQEFLVPEAN